MEAAVVGLLMGGVNRNIISLVVWTIGEHVGVCDHLRGLDCSNAKSTLIRWGLPSGLRVGNKSVLVDEVGVEALKPFCGALLKTRLN